MVYDLLTPLPGVRFGRSSAARPGSAESRGRGGSAGGTRAPAGFLPGTQGGGNEGSKQGVRSLGPRLELGVELTTHEVGMPAQLDHLHQLLIGRYTGDDQTMRGQRVAEVVVDLVAMAMAFRYLRDAVSRGRPSPRLQHTGIG